MSLPVLCAPADVVEGNVWLCPACFRAGCNFRRAECECFPSGGGARGIKEIRARTVGPPHKIPRVGLVGGGRVCVFPFPLCNSTNGTRFPHFDAHARLTPPGGEKVDARGAPPIRKTHSQ